MFETLGLEVETVFLDRDGVINRKPPEGEYVRSWGDFEFLPGVREALALLKRSGRRVIVVTNQRGIALGLFSQDDLNDIHERMQANLREAAAAVDGIYVCPHDEGECTCRKPQTGLFWRAKTEFPEIDFVRSLLIGDLLSDLEAGARLGCRKIVIAGAPDEARIVAEARARGIVLDGVAPSLIAAVTRYLG